MSQNTPKSKFFGDPPRTPLGSLQRSPRPSSWWGGAGCPSQEPHLRSQPFGLRASALQASQIRPPHFLNRGYAYEQTNSLETTIARETGGLNFSHNRFWRSLKTF